MAAASGEEEESTRDLLTDLIKYRTKQEIDSNPNHVKRMIRDLSNEIKDKMDIDKPEEFKYLLGNTLALETIIQVLYQNASTKEHYIFSTITLFTYIAEMCKDVSEESHYLITENVIVVLKSSIQGQFAMLLIDKMYQHEKVKTILKRVTLCSICLGVLGLVWYLQS